MPLVVFEHFFNMADNQHIVLQNKCYVFLYRPHVFVELSLFYIRPIWMLDINKVHLSLIEISEVQ